MNQPHLKPIPPAAQSEVHRPRRNTDNQLLAKWGYDEYAPNDIVEMAQLSQHLLTLRVGEAVVHLGYATKEDVERHIKERPQGVGLLEYLAQKIEGLRPEIQRILALQDGMPYYKQLGAAHPSMQEPGIMQACAKLEATLIVTPSGKPCLVFTEHDDARRYGVMGRQEQNIDPIRQYIGHTPILAVGSRASILSRLSIEYSDVGELEQTHITPASASTSTQKRLIQILEEAMHRGAENIALQPDASGMTNVRMRLHRLMRPMRSTHALPPEIAIEMANTLHAWSHATYTGKKDRVQGSLLGPADGKFTFRTSDREAFIRCSYTLPDSLGGQNLECISLRVLKRDKLNVKLTDLRIEPDVIDALAAAMQEPRGIVLLVGGTGSGKSTTIHGTLDLYKQIHGNTKNCISVEDPVERLAPGLVSHSISRDYGFELMLQAILRQEPDLVFVGEIRDRATASTSVRAANSGHIVLSSLHADDSVMAIGAMRAYIANRMAETSASLIVSDFDLVTSLNLIVAQQLVPELCPSCRIPLPKEQQIETGRKVIRYAEKRGILPPNTPSTQEMRTATIEQIARALSTSHHINPEGCRECEGLGTRGSLPISEYFVPDAHCKQLLADMFATNRINMDRLKPYRPRTLFTSALERVARGETPPESLFV